MRRPLESTPSTRALEARKASFGKILSPVPGEPEDFAGPRSLWGARIVRVVHSAVHADAGRYHPAGELQPGNRLYGLLLYLLPASRTIAASASKMALSAITNAVGWKL